LPVIDTTHKLALRKLSVKAINAHSYY
jgi:hypothetical protein